MEQSLRLLETTLRSSERMRDHAAMQRMRLREQRVRWQELVDGDVRIERLHPHLDPPAHLPVRAQLPDGRGAVVLLCGICDEVLATGTYAADLTVALRCSTCQGYNTKPEPAAR